MEIRQGGLKRQAWARTEIGDSPPLNLRISGLFYYAQGPPTSPSEAPAGRKSFSATKEEEGTAGGLQGNCGTFSVGLSLSEGAGHVPHPALLGASTSQPRLSPLPW